MQHNAHIVSTATIHSPSRVARDIKQFVDAGGRIIQCPAYLGTQLDSGRQAIAQHRIFAAVKAVYSRWERDPKGVDPISEVADQLSVPKWKVAALFGKYLGGAK